MGIKKFPEPIDSATVSQMLWDEANDQLSVSHDFAVADPTVFPGQLLEFHSDDVLSTVLALLKSRNSKAAPTTCVNGDGLGIIQFQAYNGTAYNSNAAIVATITGVIGATAFPTELALATNNGATGFTTKRLTLSASGNVSIGTAAIATTATDGFLYITSCAGLPTGTPTAITGRVPLVVDGTNERLKMYVNGAWVDALSSSSIVVRSNSGDDVGTRPRLNFVAGDNVQLLVTDDADDDEVDIKISVAPVPMRLQKRLENPDELNLMIHLANYNDFSV
jgi:hypothetical protein